MKNRILILLLFIDHFAFSQLENPSIGAGIAYSNFLDARTDKIYGTPGITIRVAADMAARHILMAGYSQYLPTSNTFTANGSVRSNLPSYYPYYNTFHYNSKLETSEMFLEALHLVRNTTENKFAVYFHTGLNIHFFKETKTFVDIDTTIYKPDIQEGKTKFAAVFIYVGPGIHFRIRSSYIFFEFKASVPIPIGDSWTRNFNFPVGFNLGYRFCFDD